MPIKLISGAGGSLTVTPASTASNYTLTVPAVTANVITSGDSNTITQTMMNTGFYAGYGPAFSAYIGGSNQTISHNTFTKVNFNTEEFDTASCYDTSTYRFTPNVAGYYHILAKVNFAISASRNYYFALDIYKNGSPYKRTQMNTATNNGAESTVTEMSLIYMNGSTNYLEIYVYHYDYTSGASTTLSTNGTYQEFSGYLVRSA